MTQPSRHPELSGQVAIVTGGTRGIGLGIVRVLARAGVKLLVTGRKPARLEQVEKELGEQGAPHVTLQVDHRDASTSATVIGRALEAFGQIDALVANAQSYRPVTPLAEVSEDDFDTVLDSGPKATLWLMQAVLPHMRARGRGRIVTFGSSMGNTGAPGYGPYSAAKEAVRSLTRTAAREWGRDGITVNCVCPASVAHRMPTTDDGGARARAFAEMYADHPAGSRRRPRRPTSRPWWPSCSRTPAST